MLVKKAKTAPTFHFCAIKKTNPSPPRMAVKIILEDELVDKAVEAIIKSTNTNRIGDGKIFVSNIESITRIRTGETGPDAL